MIGIRTIVALITTASLGLSIGTSWAQTLNNDEFVFAQFSAVGEVDRYLFDADAGDSVFISMAGISDTLVQPSMRLFSPGGQFLAAGSGPNITNFYAFEFPDAGRYSIELDDDGVASGRQYRLFFARVPGTNLLGRLNNDTRVSNTLENGDVHSYTFDALVGDHIHLNVVDSGSTLFNPLLWLFDPDGELVERSLGAPSAALRNVEITQSGVWTAVFTDNSDNRDDSANDYDLFFTNTRDANEKGILPNDARRSAALTRGDIDTWVFDAQADERIYLTVADINNSAFNPDIQLYAPDGTRVRSVVKQAVAAVSDYAAPLSGQYVVVVQDENADDAGNYELHFAKAPGAAEGGTLSGVDIRLDSLTLGDIDTYEFGANAGGFITLTAEDTGNTPLSPQLFVYDENSNLVAGTTSIDTASLFFSAAITGFYTVVVKDFGSASSSDYRLTYSYSAAAPPPKRTRSVIIEPNVWHLLGVPGNTGGTLGDVFSSGLDLSLYDNNTATGGWVMFAYDTTAPSDVPNEPGVYRKLLLSEPPPLTNGFWLLHTNTGSVQISLPINSIDAAGMAGINCTAGSSCVTSALDAPNAGGWIIGTVPSTQVPVASDFTLVTEISAPACLFGCSFIEAANAGYVAPNGVWEYESRTGQFRLRAKNDSIAPWSGFWLRANAPMAQSGPLLFVPVGKEGP